MKKAGIYLLLLILTLSILGTISCSSSSTPTSTTPANTSPAAATSAPAAKAVVLRLAMGAPPVDPMVAEIEKMAKKVTERTNGRYKMEVYAGDSLIKTTEALDAVRTGTVEMANCLPSWLSGSDMIFSTAELPFMFNNLKAAYAGCEPLRQIYSAVLEKKFNQKMIQLYASSDLELCSRKPVQSMDNWKGLLVAGQDNNVSLTVQALGGSPVSMPWPDQYPSLQKGVIDGAFSTTMAMMSLKEWEVAPNLVLCGAFPCLCGTMINLDLWNKMAKEDQDILIQEANNCTASMKTLFLQSTDSVPQDLAKAGMKVYTLPAAERDKWKAASRTAYDKIMSGVGSDAQKITDIINKANSDNP